PPRRDTALNDVVDFRQALGRHADSARRLHRKTVALGGDTRATAGSEYERGQQQRKHQRVSWKGRPAGSTERHLPTEAPGKQGAELSDLLSAGGKNLGRP